MELIIAGKSVVTPLCFNIPLDYPPEDLDRFEWLKSRNHYYQVERQIGDGGYAIGYLGYPCDAGGVRVPKSPNVVLKIPNLGDEATYPTPERSGRQQYIRQRAIEEWKTTRRKMLDCAHGSPIFDLGTVWVGTNELFVSAQQYLANAKPLLDWMVDEKLKSAVTHNAAGEPEDKFLGLNGTDWFRVANMIAIALAAVHRRRVIHGDIWPDNIFVDDSDIERAVFIDFGESFVSLPTGDHRSQPNHSYRAPERGAPDYVPTEQIDIYSFGKLLLYLAIGTEFNIPVELFGRQRRDVVRTEILRRNRNLVVDHPRIVDIIARCTAIDPVDRPSAKDLCEEISNAQCRGTTPMKSSPAGVVARSQLEEIVSAMKTGAIADDSVFMTFVQRKIAELHQLIEDTTTMELVELDGTRDQLIHDLQALLSGLGNGDSWTALTDPSVWQSNALGLDGRYGTATIEALRAGASVHRTFVVSVEELGTKFCELLESGLASEPDEDCQLLATRVRRARRDYERLVEDDIPVPPMDFVEAHQRQLVSLVSSLHTMVTEWSLTEKVHKGIFKSIRETAGLFLGMAFVPMLAHRRELRIQNPAALLCLDKQIANEKMWLLVMTDIRDRHDRDFSKFRQCQMRGVRIYRSVMGVPNDRIIAAKRLFGEQSVNIGWSLPALIRHLTAAKTGSVEKSNVTVTGALP